MAEEESEIFPSDPGEGIVVIKSQFEKLQQKHTGGLSCTFALIRSKIAKIPFLDGVFCLKDMFFYVASNKR